MAAGLGNGDRGRVVAGEFGDPDVEARALWIVAASGMLTFMSLEQPRQSGPDTQENAVCTLRDPKERAAREQPAKRRQPGQASPYRGKCEGAGYRPAAGIPRVQSRKRHVPREAGRHDRPILRMQIHPFDPTGRIQAPIQSDLAPA